MSLTTNRHVVPPAQISLTLSRHVSLLFIASGRFSELQPVSSQSCCMYVRAGRLAFEWPYVGFHWNTSLMVCLTWIVFVMGGRWPYSCCFMGCCLQDIILLTAFLCNCRLAFSPALLKYKHTHTFLTFNKFIITKEVKFGYCLEKIEQTSLYP